MKIERESMEKTRGDEKIGWRIERDEWIDWDRLSIPSAKDCNRSSENKKRYQFYLNQFLSPPERKHENKKSGSYDEQANHNIEYQRNGIKI